MSAGYRSTLIARQEIAVYCKLRVQLLSVLEVV